MPYTFGGRWGPEPFLNPNGRPQAGASVTVRLRGTTTAATLYTDRTKATAAANPFTTDSTGNGTFFADPGEYDLFVRDVTIPVTVPVDPEESESDVAALRGQPNGLAELDASGNVPASQSGASVTYVDGLDATGATDQAALINSKLTEAAAGSTLIFRAGRYRIDSQVAWANKELHMQAEGRVVFVEGVAQTAPLILATSADGSSISGVTIEGIETAVSFSGADSDRDGIRFTDSNRVRVVDVTVTGKSVGVRLQNCTRSKVVRPTITGFGVSGLAGVNYHSGVRIVGGSRNNVVEPDAQDIGTAVLCGAAVERCSIYGGHGFNCWDNGIYISSGNGCVVTGFEADTVDGAGVKMRGSRNVAQGCVVRNATVGLHITPVSGAVADALGAGSAGSIVANCTVETTSADGILFGSFTAQTLYPRHIRVANNVLRNTATTVGGSAAIRGTANYAAITDNTIENCDSPTGAIVLAGIAGDPNVATLKGMTITGNSIVDSAGDGIRCSFTTESVFADNHGLTITGDLLDLRIVTNSTISGNHARNIAAVVRTDASCTENQIQWNHGENGATRSLLLAGNDWVFHRDLGAPVVIARRGSMWLRDDGGASTTLYVKESGDGANTGWVAK